MDYVELERIIRDRGLKKYAVADKLGISRNTFYIKLLGEREFTQGEVMQLKKVLNLSDDEFMKIFFNDGVGKMPTEV